MTAAIVGLHGPRRPPGVAARTASERALALLVPAEHGGWGLTAEPAVLGLLIAWSAAGAAIAVATLLAFLVRTPMKVVLVDRRRRRHLPRTRLAAVLAGAELALLAGAVAAALALAGARWLLPWLVAAPLFAIELSFDARSRGRRLVPELCGAVGITASAAAIVLAGGGTTSTAIAAWILLAARAIASVTFARVQVTRGRSQATPRGRQRRGPGGRRGGRARGLRGRRRRCGWRGVRAGRGGRGVRLEPRHGTTGEGRRRLANAVRDRGRQRQRVRLRGRVMEDVGGDPAAGRIASTTSVTTSRRVATSSSWSGSFTGRRRWTTSSVRVRAAYVDWPGHIAVVSEFWMGQLFGTAAYEGNPLRGTCQWIGGRR